MILLPALVLSVLMIITHTYLGLHVLARGVIFVDLALAQVAALAPLKGKPVIAYHSSFLYLADAFGLHIVDHVEPVSGITPGAAHLQKLVARIKTEQVGLLIMEPYYERRSASYLAEQTGIKVAVLPQSVGSTPEIVTYFDLFDGIVAALQKSGVLK